MKENEIPCPFPKGFKGAPPKESETNDVPTGPVYQKFPPEHGEGSSELFDSIWGVPDGRRDR